MKKLFYFAIAALAFVACSEDTTDPVNPVVEAAIEVTTDVAALEIPAEGGEVTIEFTSALGWTAANVDNVAGVELDPPFGEAGEATLKVTVGANETEGERTINIALKSEEVEKVLALKQLYVAPEPEPYFNSNLSETREFWCGPEASTVTLEIDTNVEYEVTLKNEEAAWITMTDNGDDTFTFTLTENPNGGYRSVVGNITHELAEAPIEFYIFQNGVAAREWRTVVRDLAGYNAELPCELALFGDYLLVANGSNIFALNVADGTLATTIALPEGVTAQSIEVDEGDNILICTTPVEDIVTVYTTKSVEAAPTQLLQFHTGNAYGGGYGNIRVAGNIDTKALLFLDIAGYWTEAGNTAGFVAAYEITDGAATLDANGWAQFTFVDNAFGTNAITRNCAYPLGTSLTDGALFVGYGTSMYYAADASVRPTSWVECANLGGNGWMENYSCIDVTEVNGKKIAGLVASCLFNYDQPDLVVVDFTDPAAGQLLGTFTFYDPTSETENYEAAFKGNGVSGAESSDIVLVPTENGIKAYVTDGAWGAVSCVTYAIL